MCFYTAAVYTALVWLLIIDINKRNKPCRVASAALRGQVYLNANALGTRGSIDIVSRG